LLICAPFDLIHLLITEDLTDNMYIMMLLKYLLPLTAVGFFVFGVSDWIHLKLGLYDAKKNQDEVVEGSDDETELLLNEGS